MNLESIKMDDVPCLTVSESPRSEIFKKHKRGDDIGLNCVNCIASKEERLIEEAPYAYREIDDVINV